MAKAKAKRRRTKQLHMEGTEPEHIRELDDAAWAYYEVMRERCEFSRREKELKQNLIDKMNQHGIGRYETENGLIVVVNSSHNVTAKPKESEPLTSDDDE